MSKSEIHPVPLFLAGNTMWRQLKDWVPGECLKPFGTTFFSYIYRIKKQGGNKEKKEKEIKQEVVMWFAFQTSSVDQQIGHVSAYKIQYYWLWYFKGKTQSKEQITRCTIKTWISYLLTCSLRCSCGTDEFKVVFLPAFRHCFIPKLVQAASQVQRVGL